MFSRLQSTIHAGGVIFLGTAVLTGAPMEADDSDLYSLVLIQADLFDATQTMTICDLNEDGFIDASERSKLPWRDRYEEVDMNKDGKLTHLEVAVRQAKLRAAHDITQFDRNNARNLMRKNDSNGNGELDPDEIAKGWPPMPEEYDINSDGKITLGEMAKQLAYKRGLRRELGIEAVDNMSSVRAMKQFDSDGDSELNADEWASAGLPREGKLHDDDGNGKLSYTELALLFSKHRRDTGLSKSDAIKAKQLLQLADRDQDGKLTAEEMSLGVFSAGGEGAIEYKQYDGDSDGTVTLAEIQRFLASERKQKGYDDDHLKEAKRLMLRHDQDRSNHIELHELAERKTTGQLGREILPQADENKDEKLSVVELAKYLATRE